MGLGFTSHLPSRVHTNDESGLVGHPHAHLALRNNTFDDSQMLRFSAFGRTSSLLDEGARNAALAAKLNTGGALGVSTVMGLEDDNDDRTIPTWEELQAAKAAAAPACSMQYPPAAFSAAAQQQIPEAGVAGHKSAALSRPSIMLDPAAWRFGSADSQQQQAPVQSLVRTGSSLQSDDSFSMPLPPPQKADAAATGLPDEFQRQHQLVEPLQPVPVLGMARRGTVGPLLVIGPKGGIGAAPLTVGVLRATDHGLKSSQVSRSDLTGGRGVCLPTATNIQPCMAHHDSLAVLRAVKSMRELAA